MDQIDNYYDDEKKYFVTNNVYLATALMCCDFELEKTKVIHQEVLYIFKNKSGIHKKVNEYFLNTLNVSASIYALNFRELQEKSQLRFRYRMDAVPDIF